MELWGRDRRQPKDLMNDLAGVGPTLFPAEDPLPGGIQSSFMPDSLTAGNLTDATVILARLPVDVVSGDRIFIQVPPGTTFQRPSVEHATANFSQVVETSAVAVLGADTDIPYRRGGGYLMLIVDDDQGFSRDTDLVLRVLNVLLAYPANPTPLNLSVWIDGGSTDKPKYLSTNIFFPSLTHPSCHLQPLSMQEGQATLNTTLEISLTESGSFLPMVETFFTPAFAVMEGLFADQALPSKFARSVVDKYQFQNGDHFAPDAIELSGNGTKMTIDLGALPTFNLGSDTEIVRINLPSSLVVGSAHSMLCTGQVTIFPDNEGRVLIPSSFPTLVAGERSPTILISLSRHPDQSLIVTPVGPPFVKFESRSLTFDNSSDPALPLTIIVDPTIPATGVYPINFQLSGADEEGSWVVQGSQHNLQLVVPELVTIKFKEDLFAGQTADVRASLSQNASPLLQLPADSQLVVEFLPPILIGLANTTSNDISSSVSTGGTASDPSDSSGAGSSSTPLGKTPFLAAVIFPTFTFSVVGDSPSFPLIDLKKLIVSPNAEPGEYRVRVKLSGLAARAFATPADIIITIRPPLRIAPIVFPPLPFGGSRVVSISVSALPEEFVTVTPESAGVTFTPASLVFSAKSTSITQFLNVTASPYLEPSREPRPVFVFLGGPDASSFEPPAVGRLDIVDGDISRRAGRIKNASICNNMTEDPVFWVVMVVIALLLLLLSLALISYARARNLKVRQLDAAASKRNSKQFEEQEYLTKIQSSHSGAKSAGDNSRKWMVKVIFLHMSAFHYFGFALCFTFGFTRYPRTSISCCFHILWTIRTLAIATDAHDKSTQRLAVSPHANATTHDTWETRGWKGGEWRLQQKMFSESLLSCLVGEGEAGP